MPSQLLIEFSFVVLECPVLSILIHVPEKRATNIRRMTSGSPMLAIKRAPADHDTQACCLGPKFCNIVIGNFYHGWYIVAIPDAGVVYALRAWHRFDQEQSWRLFVNSGSRKKMNVLITLSFNLVKVCCPAILYFTSRTKTLNYFQFFLCHIYGLYLLSYS